MRNLTRSIMNLHCLTGDSMNLDLYAALQPYSVSEEMQKEMGKRYQDVFQFRLPTMKPVYADLRWWCAEQWHDGTLDQTLSSLSDYDRNVVLMCLIGNKYQPPFLYEPVEGVELVEEWSGEPVVYANGGYPGTKHHVTVKTPVGTLTACEEYAERSFGITEYPVKDLEDLPIARYIYQQRAKYARPDKATGCCPMVPMQVLLVQLAGVENTAFMMADDPDEVDDFLNFLDDIFMPAIDAYTKGGRTAWSAENLDAGIGSGYYHQYIGPVLRRRSIVARKNGGKIGIHHDGKLMPMLGWHQDYGVDEINGLTAAPAGDLDIREIRKVTGPRIVLNDMIPQALFMPAFSELAFENFIEEAAAFYRDDPGVIFGIGDMLPSCSDVRRYIKMRKIIEEVTRR